MRWPVAVAFITLRDFVRMRIAELYYAYGTAPFSHGKLISYNNQVQVNHVKRAYITLTNSFN